MLIDATIARLNVTSQGSSAVCGTAEDLLEAATMLGT